MLHATGIGLVRANDVLVKAAYGMRPGSWNDCKWKSENVPAAAAVNNANHLTSTIAGSKLDTYKLHVSSSPLACRHSFLVANTLASVLRPVLLVSSVPIPVVSHRPN